MILAAFTLFHVVLSLVGIAAGFVVLQGLMTAKWSDRWTLVFLTTTAATSVTGFLFPFHEFLPSHGVGIVSLIVLAIAIPALYVYHLTGAWAKTYAITAVMALYLNVFVLIVQLFLKVPLLHAMAPTQSEPPFLVTQVIVLLIFAVLGYRAASSLRGQPLQAA
ncbi:MAG: hypothetical protein ABI822_06195 [Bryobacteraceae bacterium]